MKITLKNFRKHVSREISFPKTGFVLLDAPNGMGKSTILNSIYYALYGTVADSFPPYTRGTTTCKVEISYRNHIITRTSRPNRLLVKSADGTVYEDDAAQGVVDTIMKANALEFFYSSFVIQRAHNSVLSMTPINQLKFIEALAFSDNKHVEYLKKTKEFIKARKLEIATCEAEIGVIESSLREKERGLGKVKKVSPPDGIEKAEKLLKELNGQADEKKEILDQIGSEEKKWREKEKRLIEVSKEIECLEASLDCLCRQSPEEPPNMDELSNEDLAPSKDCSPQAINILRDLLESKREYEKYAQDRETFETLVTNHFSALEKKRDSLKTRVFSLEQLDELVQKKEALVKTREIYISGTAQNEALEADRAEQKKKIKAIIKEYAQTAKASKQLLHYLEAEKTSLEASIHQLNKEARDRELEKEVFVCPSCDTNLFFNQSRLVLKKNKKSAQSEEISDKLIDLHKKLTLIIEHAKTVELGTKIISKPLIEIPEFSEEEYEKLEDSIQHEKKKLEEFQKLETEISKRTLPSTLRELETKVKNEIEDPCIEKTSGDILEELHEKETAIEERERTRQEIDELQKKIDEKKKLRDKLNRVLENKSSSATTDLSNEISELQQRIIDTQTSISEKREKLAQARAYEQYLERKRSLEKTSNELKEKKEKLGALNRRLRGCIGLVEACKQAEILAVEKTIQSINAASKVHIDAFFDVPITVRLETVQKDTGKLSIRTVIDYDGMTYSDVSELGGGNSQKCEIAFVLGVSDMVGSRILMLDECVNNTSTDVKIDMLNYIKEVCSKKLVLVISHDSIEGVFDEIVHLD